MNYPIWMIAWRQTKQGDILDKQEIIKNEREADNFSSRYYNRIIKTRELTNEERINHGFLPVLEHTPTATPATKNKSKLAAIIQKIWLWIISNTWKFILGVAVAIAAAYFLVRFKIPH